MELTGRRLHTRAAPENELMPEHRDASVASDVTASAALLLYSAAVVGGFARVFSGWDFFDNLLMVAVVGHGLALALRLFRVPVWVAFPVTGLGLVWLVGAMFYRDTYSLLLPTSDTWDLFRLELDLVGEQFRTAVAPVAFLAGWDVLAALGIAAAVLLADTFAFRAFARAEALVPGGVLFVFVAALGTDRIRVASTMALVAAGVVATIVLRQHHAPERTSTIGVSRINTGRVIPVAVGSALFVAVIAGFVGPRLPGADAEPIYDTKGGSGGSVTEVVSPLVDIRSRLTNRTTTELFTVQADTDSYWRSSALPKFDGDTWGLPERGLSRADGTIGQGVAGAIEIRQQVTIAALGGALLPAAADPVAATGEGELRDDLRWNADSATLVKTGGDLETGDRFSIVSASPRFSSATLSSATSTDPGDPIYFELPSDFPESVEVAAREVTAGSTSSYAAALALQNWMRSDFTYSLEIQEGHGNNAIESFLVNRVGLLRAVRRHLRRHAALDQHPGPRRGGIHPGRQRRERHVLGARSQRTRVARGLVRRHRLGPVRADARPRCPGRRGVHGCHTPAGRGPGRRRRPGRVRRTADHRRGAGDHDRRRRRRPHADDRAGRTRTR